MDIVDQWTISQLMSMNLLSNAKTADVLLLSVTAPIIKPSWLDVIAIYSDPDDW